MLPSITDKMYPSVSLLAHARILLHQPVSVTSALPPGARFKLRLGRGRHRLRRRDHAGHGLVAGAEPGHGDGDGPRRRARLR